MMRDEYCPRCGAVVRLEEKYCRQCGAPLWVEPVGNAAADASGWVPGTVPVTIEQLRQFCAYNEMPLDRMRFFVGEDCREARAFGIYRDGDQCVVYKNKSDGSRAVRYHGPDEAYAVNELYQKLLDECHKRDIWPDGKSEAQAQQAVQAKKHMRKAIVMMVLMVVLIVGFMLVTGIMDHRRHAHDGYYRFDDDGLYYLYGSSWYYDDPYYDWVLASQSPYDDYGDYYLGDDYDSEWGYSDFEKSDAWQDIRESERSSSHTSSDDYSSWDSGSTDWDSDW